MFIDVIEERAAVAFTVEGGGSSFLRDVRKYLRHVPESVFFSL
jgi:hypothetical protein